MKNVSADWPLVKFGDVVQLNKDRCVDPLDAGIERYVGLEHIEPDDLRILRWGLVAEGTTFTNLFRPGQVLFGKRRAYQRKVAVADFTGVCSSDIYVFESKDPGVLLPDLLPFICQTDGFYNHAVGTSAGSLSPRTNWTQLAQFEFALPPLDEQRRIAVSLRSIDRVQESILNIVDAAQRLWQATAEHYFSATGGVSRTGRNVAKLGKHLVYASDGPFGSKLKTEHYSDDGVRVVRLQNIDALAFNDQDKAYVLESYFRSQLKRYEVRPGDILIAGLGDDSIPAGRACLAPTFLGTAINKADCYCLRTDGSIEARYLVCFLNSAPGLRQSAAFAQGTTRYRLNLANIRRMEIPMPSLSIQREAADTLETIHCSEVTARQRYLSTETAKRTLIRQLLEPIPTVQEAPSFL